MSGIILAQSRISHHTITATGASFSIPQQEDFTLTPGLSGSWTIYDLANEEIGVNEADNKAYIRIGNNINEFQFTGSTTSTGGTAIGITGSIQYNDGSGGFVGNDYFVWNSTANSFAISTTSSSVVFGVRQDPAVIAGSASEIALLVNKPDYSTGFVSSESATGSRMYFEDNVSGNIFILNMGIDQDDLPDNLTLAAFDVNTGTASAVLLEPNSMVLLSPEFSFHSNQEQSSLSTQLGASNDYTKMTSWTMSTSGSGSQSYTLTPSLDGVDLYGMNVDVQIHGRSGTAGSYGSKLFGCFKWNGVAPVLDEAIQIGTTDVVEKSDFSTASSNIEITPTGRVGIKVYGEPGLDIEWSLFINQYCIGV